MHVCHTKHGVTKPFPAVVTVNQAGDGMFQYPCGVLRSDDQYREDNP